MSHDCYETCDDVDGDFDMLTDELVAVGNKKYGSVHLCFKTKTWNLTFAQVRLHSRNTANEADAVFEDAYRLAEEICKRWNKEVKEVKEET